MLKFIEQFFSFFVAIKDSAFKIIEKSQEKKLALRRSREIERALARKRIDSVLRRKKD